MMVSILIGAKNQLNALTKPCIESIHRTVTVPYELIGIDDGSGDGTFAYMKRTCHKALRLHGIGCGAMRNRALPYASGDHIMFLDNDVFPDKRGWLRTMLEDCSKPGVGIIGPILSNESAKAALPRSPDGLIDTSMVAGACFLFPRSTFERLGMLDPAFSRRGEDSDYSLRARLAFLRVVLTPRVYLHHKGGATYDWSKEKGQLKAFRKKYKDLVNVFPIP